MFFFEKVLQFNRSKHSITNKKSEKPKREKPEEKLIPIEVPTWKAYMWGRVWRVFVNFTLTLLVLVASVICIAGTVAGIVVIPLILLFVIEPVWRMYVRDWAWEAGVGGYGLVADLVTLALGMAFLSCVYVWPFLKLIAIIIALIGLGTYILPMFELVIKCAGWVSVKCRPLTVWLTVKYGPFVQLAYDFMAGLMGGIIDGFKAEVGMLAAAVSMWTPYEWACFIVWVFILVLRVRYLKRR